MTVVIDASVVLAILRDEDGSHIAMEALGDGAVMSTANLAEVATRLIDEGWPPERIAFFKDPRMRIMPVTEDHAYSAAEMRPATRSHGLSLADRLCLALAMELSLPAVTADRSWLGLDLDPPVEVICIRD